MTIKYDATAYEVAFRPNYEMQQVLVWWAGAGIYAMLSSASAWWPSGPMWWLCGICVLMGALKVKPAKGFMTSRKTSRVGRCPFVLWPTWKLSRK